MAVQHILQSDHLALNIKPPRLNDIERLIENHFLSFSELLRLDRRMKTDFHLTPGYVNIRCAVFIDTGKNSVGGRRSRQFFNLGTQRFYLRLGFLEGRDKLLVLLRCLIELIAGLVEAPDLFFHRLDLDTKFFNFADMLFVFMYHDPISVG